MSIGTSSATLAALLVATLAMAVIGGCGGGDEREATGVAGDKSVVTKTVQPPTVTKTVTKKPKPAPTPTETHKTYVLPDPGGGSDGDEGRTLAQDLANAGITAPTGWAIDTANQICGEWAQGNSTAETDQILLEGGIYAEHLDEFNDIAERWMCPGLQP